MTSTGIAFILIVPTTTGIAAPATSRRLRFLTSMLFLTIFFGRHFEPRRYCNYQSVKNRMQGSRPERTRSLDFTYLAGELSSATNGAALRVDGGVVKAIL